MKNSFILINVLLLLLTACNDESLEETTTEPTPIAQVKTIKLQQSNINETLTVYGTVLPWADKVQTISLPYSSQVEKILVNDGQLVQQGETLLTLKPSKDALLQLAQARQELAAAQQAQKLLQERVELKLATQQDVVAGQLRVDQAKAMIENLMARGVTQQQQVMTADHAGMVSMVSVQQGQIVPAGNPLLQLVDKNQWVVRLGVEPEDFDHLQVQQEVFITPVNKPVAQPVKGRVEIITQQIDPATRLLNVFVRPEANQALLINDFVQADITVSAKQTLVVPRSAVLPDGNAYRLFTINKGHAIKHTVQIGLENATQFEIISDDVKENDEVVILGNYELQDGMAVELKPL
jgi:membrane fusion protein, multidrug efflux system